MELETHRFEDLLVRLVIDAVSQGVVDSVVFAFASANVLKTGKTDTQLHVGVVEGKGRGEPGVSGVGLKELDGSLTLRSPVPGKYSPYLWKETVMTLSVV